MRLDPICHAAQHKQDSYEQCHVNLKPRESYGTWMAIILNLNF